MIEDESKRADLPKPVQDKPFYDANSVALATLIGSPAAGATLMALNYQRMGEKNKASRTLILCILWTALAIWLGTFIPRFGAIAFSVALIVGMRVLAVQLQGKAVEDWIASGGKRGSRWKAAKVGTTWLCLLIVAVGFPAYWYSVRNRVVVGSRDEVYFTGQANRDDARKLGDALKKNGYFQDTGASVFLDKDRDGATLSLVEQEGIWDQPEMLSSAEEVAREVAPAIGGFPVRVHLANANQEVKKQGLVGHVPVGKDEIFYLGNAAKNDAEALGRGLTADGYFENAGATVLLSKDARGTVLSFVVGEGVWDNAEDVKGFEAIAREVAPSLGGLPILLRLANTTLEIKKELVVR